MVALVSNVLVDDPDLGRGLDGDRLERARRELVARVVILDEREWHPQRDAAAARGGIGLLVVGGLLVRRVGRDRRFGAELLGPGDLLRPWQDDGEDASLPFETTFTVALRVQLALLDRAFSLRLAPYPEVIGNLVGRALQRARTLAVHLAIVHQRRVDRRLLMLFWHLADRWGHVTPEGVRVPLQVTHQVLADLVGSHRPAVTTALSQLHEAGLVTRRQDDWLLTGGAPADLYRTDG